MFSERGEEQRAGGGERRPVVYCLIPQDLAEKLHEPLRRHFRDDPGVEVVVERREAERRRARDRRRKKGKLAAKSDRRRILAVAGRRIADRRAAQVPVAPPPLPRRAARFTDRIGFVERMEPSTEEAEDRDTARVVARFQSGDRDAFSILYARYYERVFSYLRMLLNNTHDAEDGAQQVFMQVLEGLHRYERREVPFRAWLFRCVRNYALYHLRQTGRIEPVDPAELEALLDESESSEEPASVVGWIADRDLALFVERLPLPQRQVLALRYVLDLSHAQVAAILGRTESDVRALQTRALRFLNDRLTAIGRVPIADSSSEERSQARTFLRQAPVLRGRRWALWDD